MSRDDLNDAQKDFRKAMNDAVGVTSLGRPRARETTPEDYVKLADSSLRLAKEAKADLIASAEARRNPREPSSNFQASVPDNFGAADKKSNPRTGDMAEDTTLTFNSSAVDLNKSAAEQRKAAEFRGTGAHGWVEDFVGGLKYDTDGHHTRVAENKDVAGAKALGALRNMDASPAAIEENQKKIDQFLKDGLSNINFNTSKLIDQLQIEADANEAYQPLLDRAKKLGEKIAKLDEERFKLKATFAEKVSESNFIHSKFATEKEAHLGLNHEEITEGFNNRSQELDVRFRDLTARFEAMDGPVAYEAGKRDVKSAFPDEFKEYEEAKAALMAERGKYEAEKARFTPEAIEAEEREYQAERRKLNDGYKQSMLAVLHLARDYTEESKRIPAETALKKAEIGGDKEAIAAAQFDLDHLSKAPTDTTIERQIDKAAEYASKVQKGRDARDDLRQKYFGDFVEGLTRPGTRDGDGNYQGRGELQLAFDKRIKNATTPEEAQSLEDERQEFIAKLEAKKGDNALTKQIDVALERIAKPLAGSNKTLDNESQIKLRGELFEYAMKHSKQPENLAANFFAEHSDRAVKEMGPVNLSKLTGSRDGEQVGINASDVLQITIRNGHAEVLLKGNAENKKGDSTITLSEYDTQKILKNGLDLQNASKRIFINVEAGVVGDNGERLLLSGTKGKDVKITVTSDSDTRDADKEREVARTFDAIGSAGDLDRRIGRMTGERAQNAMNRAATSEDRNENRALAGVDTNKDGQVTLKEFAKTMDRDGDGMLSQAELDTAQRNPLFDKLFAGKEDFLKQLGSQLREAGSVPLTDLGEMVLAQVPGAKQATQLAQATQPAQGGARKK